MVFYSNFQSRWYLFLIIYILLQHNNLLIPKIIFKQFKYVIILCSSIILIFYFYFLSFVVFNSLTNSFLDTKQKTVYLYSEIKDLEKTTGDKLILTNTRSNYFSNKLIKYKYTNYFLQNANEITDINSIKYGFFSIGSKFNDIEELKKFSILNEFKQDCYEIISFSNNPVAKRNLFSRKDYEKFIFIEFNKNIKNCFNN